MQYPALAKNTSTVATAEAGTREKARRRAAAVGLPPFTLHD